MENLSRRAGGILELLPVLRTLGQLAANPPIPGDWESCRNWVLTGIGPMGVLAKRSETKLDDDLIKTIGVIVQTPEFELIYSLFYGIIEGNYGDEDSLKVSRRNGEIKLNGKERRGLRAFRRLRGKEERMLVAARKVAKANPTEFRAMTPKERSEAVLDKMYGDDRKLEGPFEDVDWDAILAFITKLIELLLPLIMMF